MCGRFISPSESDIERYWHLVPGEAYRQSFNVAPSQDVWVIRHDSQGIRTVAPLRWGFRPVWAKREWINARAETVFDTRAFAAAAKSNRCIVPAIGWYEWSGEKPARQPHVLHLDGFKPFAFAGIYTARESDSGWERSFAILTRRATDAIATIHDRMPVVLTAEQQARWLDAAASRAALEALLAPAPDAAIQSYPVSTLVNRPANDTPECMQPADPILTGSRR
jgi:putative SOS response-associated peptidase YedK